MDLVLTMTILRRRPTPACLPKKFEIALEGMSPSDSGTQRYEIVQYELVILLLNKNCLQGQRTREMHVPVPVDTASLGLSLQYSPLALAANIWHILDVPANSPADTAGLLPYSDYILGSPEAALHGESALGEIVEDYIGRPLRLYVYNNEYNVTREVTIQPSRDWGGEGALGCVLGYGALHRLPAPLSEPVNAPGETMFDGASNEKADIGFVPTGSPAIPPSADSNYLVPAQMVNSAPPSGPPKGGKKKEKTSHSPNALMDDYFKEEEAKSRKLDNAPASQGTGAPPPPTSGGPPKGPPKAAEGDQSTAD